MVSYLYHQAPYKTLLTTPAPTVRPPSRIANLRPGSIAIGYRSSKLAVTLSPGMTISVPSFNVTVPVENRNLKYSNLKDSNLKCWTQAERQTTQWHIICIKLEKSADWHTLHSSLHLAVLKTSTAMLESVALATSVHRNKSKYSNLNIFASLRFCLVHSTFGTWEIRFITIMRYITCMRHQKGLWGLSMRGKDTPVISAVLKKNWGL